MIGVWDSPDAFDAAVIGWRHTKAKLAIICSNLKVSCRDARVARDERYEGRRS